MSLADAFLPGGAAITVAVAVVLARREAAKWRRLSAHAQALLSSTDVVPALVTFARDAARALGAKDGVVMLRQDNDLVALASTRSDVYPTAQSLCRGAFSERAHQRLPSVRVILEGRPIELRDVDAYDGPPGFGEACRTVGIRAVLSVPIRGPTGISGALNLGFGKPRRFRRRDLRLAAAIAAQGAVALEWARATERERRALRALRELDELKSDFLSTVSHELRTPLTGIKGFSATLASNWNRMDDSLRHDLVRRIAAEAVDLEGLIDNLLDFARVERGAVQVRQEPVDVGIEVRRTLARLAGELEGHRVEIDVPRGLTARADGPALARVIANLASNAAKFSSRGSRITLAAVADEREVVVSVTDEGVGIDPDDLPRVFDRFFRGVRGDKASVGGTGIGLAIVKQFVEAMGGTVWVDSALGRGSRFSFSLARASADRFEPEHQTRWPEAAPGVPSAARATAKLGESAASRAR